MSLICMLYVCSSVLALDKDAVRKAVQFQVASYPESHLADLYKSFFQDRFGPGHIISSRESARDYIFSELESADTLALPYLEPCGWEHNYMRVSLAAVRDGIVTVDALTDALVQSAAPVREEDLESWKEEWKEILSVISEECPDLPGLDSEKQLIDSLLASGQYAFHHSGTYERLYHPHYRILRKELAESIMAAHFLSAAAKNVINGPNGDISFKISLPDGFDISRDRCPMVILMHGIFSSKDYNPMPAIAKSLAANGIASIRFDFDGHGKSGGRMQDMTIEREIADAMTVWRYVRSLPYVSGVGLLGHSQGGVVASMTAGRLAEAGETASGLVLIAPGSVIKEACQGGKFFNARFDPSDPPEFIRCWGIKKLGREYLISTQSLDIYGTASSYGGPVLLIHGTKDRIVPRWCSERFLETYGDKADLAVVEGENHTITKKKKEVTRLVHTFFSDIFVQK